MNVTSLSEHFRTCILQEYTWDMTHHQAYIPRVETVVDHVCQHLYFNSHLYNVPFHMDLEHQTWDWCMEEYKKMQLFGKSVETNQYVFEPVVRVF